MKCKKQSRYHRLAISNVWEVRLDRNLWVRVQRAARNYDCTFSWICRYCVFRLVRKKRLQMHPAMEKLSRAIKKEYQKADKSTFHRHLLCLYGDDEKLLRLTAMQLEMTISHMIRFCLIWFLPKLEKESFDKRHLFYYGTKICRFLDISRINSYKFPFIDTIFYTKWPIESWWKRPFPFIPVPFSPANHISGFYKAMDPSENFHQGILKWKLCE